jgi:2-polyprenyl-3-methyl-5-hydroxy-6-metoxy-1,4-benzoquinol methylase
MGNVALARTRRERDCDAPFSYGGVTPLGCREYLEQVPASSARARGSAGGTSRNACSARWGGYHNNLVASWLPALDGMTARLDRGAKVADVGCGHGFSTITLAKAFPSSTSVGYDFHAKSIEQAREHARRHGVTANTRFELGLASDFPGKDLDLVTFFDCLHDMGDPVGAARHVRETLKPDGKWMIVEPAAGDRLEDNLNPVSRLYYAASTLICVPTSLDQPVGAALGAQAGFARLSSVIHEGRLYACAQGDGDAVQHDPRSTTLKGM